MSDVRHVQEIDPFVDHRCRIEVRLFDSGRVEILRILPDEPLSIKVFEGEYSPGSHARTDYLAQVEDVIGFAVAFSTQSEFEDRREACGLTPENCKFFEEYGDPLSTEAEDLRRDRFLKSTRIAPHPGRKVRRKWNFST